MYIGVFCIVMGGSVMANRIAHGNVTTMTMGMTDNDDGIAQDGSHNPANRLTSRYVALVYSILL